MLLALLINKQLTQGQAGQQLVPPVAAHHSGWMGTMGAGGQPQAQQAQDTGKGTTE